MNLLPRSMFGQLVLLLALVLLATAALTNAALHYAAAQRSSVEDLAQEVVASVRDLEAKGINDVALPPGMRLADTPPAGALVTALRPRDAEHSRLPFLAELRDQVAAQLDGREVLIELAHGGVAWIHMGDDPGRWLGVYLPQFRHHAVVELSALVLAGGGVLVLLAAGYYMRRMAKLLRELAAQAPALARGEQVMAIESGPREVRELGRALADSSHKVAEVARERSVLLAGISHDLRTPLARLQLALELLPGSDPALSAGMQADIVEIEAIISQFIAYARDERDEPLQNVELVSLLHGALQTPGRAQSDWNLIAPEQLAVRGRPLALKRAIANLLTNAEHYGTAPYEICVRDERGTVTMQVSDRGPGLPEQQLHRVLEPFQRGSASQDQPGAGLGLAIVARVARMHGGELTLHNRKGGGLAAELRLGRSH